MNEQRSFRPLAVLRRLAARPEGPAVGAALLALAAMAEGLPRSGGADYPFAYAVLLRLGTTLPVALLRANLAIAALTVTTAGVLSLQEPPVLTVAGVVAQLLVLYELGRRRSRLLSPLLVLPYLVVALAGPTEASRAYAVLLAVAGAALAAHGSARRARTDAMALTATERVVAESLMEHAARGERAKIARELHDVVAHHISMIAVQAETARLTTPGMPDAGAKRLLGIGDTARSALTEMRRLLGVLREDSGTIAPQRKPQPGLTQLNELLDEARDATGARTRLIVSGRVRPLDPGIELTAYRIVQEALTNARRHAPGAAVDVELHYTDETLQLRIRDNGPGPPGTVPGSGLGAGSASGSGPGRAAEARSGSTVSEPGHGVLGMQERALTVGGRLHTGPATGGGFLVEAWLPVSQEAVA
ncbi:sensor histidine kinase [Streptomyces coryli]|uniref:sensor histidine kinase n=1 Tax=Streptomyces coryli TaxID=1128680 RepID=UPI0030B8F9D5